MYLHVMETLSGRSNDNADDRRLCYLGHGWMSRCVRAVDLLTSRKEASLRSLSPSAQPAERLFTLSPLRRYIDNKGKEKSEWSGVEWRGSEIRLLRGFAGKRERKEGRNEGRKEGRKEGGRREEE